VTPVAATTALDQLAAAKVLAIIRSDDAREAIALAEALASAGVGALELTFTTPGVEAALLEVKERLAGRALLGAGTIMTPEQLKAAAGAGADFFVSPHLDLALLEQMLAMGGLAVPGVLTPSEVAMATRAGATLLKLFPAASVGHGYMRALFGPFPGLRVLPTGGISPTTAATWLEAGALAVGMGGELVPAALRRARAWDEVTHFVSNFLKSLDERPSA